MRTMRIDMLRVMHDDDDDNDDDDDDDDDEDADEDDADRHPNSHNKWWCLIPSKEWS